MLDWTVALDASMRLIAAVARLRGYTTDAGLN
jgi:hypothetical protein